MTPRGALSNSQSKDYAQRYAQEKLEKQGMIKKNGHLLKLFGIKNLNGIIEHRIQTHQRMVYHKCLR